MSTASTVFVNEFGESGFKYAAVALLTRNDAPRSDVIRARFPFASVPGRFRDLIEYEEPESKVTEAVKTSGAIEIRPFLVTA